MCGVLAAAATLAFSDSWERMQQTHIQVALGFPPAGMAVYAGAARTEADMADGNPARASAHHLAACPAAG